MELGGVGGFGHFDGGGHVGDGDGGVVGGLDGVAVVVGAGSGDGVGQLIPGVALDRGGEGALVGFTGGQRLRRLAGGVVQTGQVAIDVVLQRVDGDGIHLAGVLDDHGEHHLPAGLNHLLRGDALGYQNRGGEVDDGHVGIIRIGVRFAFVGAGGRAGVRVLARGQGERPQDALERGAGVQFLRDLAAAQVEVGVFQRDIGQSDVPVVGHDEAEEDLVPLGGFGAGRGVGVFPGLLSVRGDVFFEVDGGSGFEVAVVLGRIGVLVGLALIVAGGGGDVHVPPLLCREGTDGAFERRFGGQFLRHFAAAHIIDAVAKGDAGERDIPGVLHHKAEVDVAVQGDLGSLGWLIGVEPGLAVGGDVFLHVDGGGRLRRGFGRGSRGRRGCGLRRRAGVGVAELDGGLLAFLQVHDGEVAAVPVGHSRRCGGLPALPLLFPHLVPAGREVGEEDEAVLVGGGFCDEHQAVSGIVAVEADAPSLDALFSIVLDAVAIHIVELVGDDAIGLRWW